MQNNYKIDPELLDRYARGICTEEEEALVSSWYIAFRQTSPQFDLEESQWEPDLADVWSNLEPHIQVEEDKTVETNWKKWLSIAASAILVGFSAYYFISRPIEENYTTSTIGIQQQAYKQKGHSIKNASIDIHPAQSGAVLILSNGEKVYLNGVTETNNRVDHEVEIDLRDQEQIVYQENNSPHHSDQALTNTLIVPKGHIYKITLADGSKVSLNADSKLTFPIQFQGKKREVYLEGEAYFEVSKRFVPATSTKEKQEFIVHAGGSAVQVLGTKFNVQAYKTDNKTSFLLEEGSISLSNIDNPAPLLLQPGQKATQVGKVLTVQEADVERELSWKNGDFYFGGISIREIMDQISRWYDIDIQYLGPVEEQQYISTISRKKSLKEVLEILETTTGLRFDIQQQGKERRLMVIP
ncbi:FecR family protein [Sphingobacterium sp. LRF_L2]|uniref:FecR family protein n=1 Tax=Sphingobacterium sp. LRF_L2 TaxID=3369421 RepID=UPI003F625259